MTKENRNRNIFDIVPNNNLKEISMKRNENIGNTDTGNKRTHGSIGIICLISLVLLILGLAYAYWGMPKQMPTAIALSDYSTRTETAAPRYDNRLLRQQIETLTNGYQADCSPNSIAPPGIPQE